MPWPDPVPDDDVRPLDDAESAVLRAILAVDAPGAEAWRAQAATVLARRGCGCGCGTIDLVAPGADSAVAGMTAVPTELVVVDDAGDPLGTVFLLTSGGTLARLEVAGYDAPLGIPPIGRTRVVAAPHGG